MPQPQSVVVLGGSGFIGRAVIAAAVSSGLRVQALTRSDATASSVAALGAEPVRGDVATPSWMKACSGADAIIDLTQPPVPKRLTVRAITGMAGLRVSTTRAMLQALQALPQGSRPMWVSVNGTDDLLPDSAGALSSRSPLRTTPRGFAYIGLPVRAAVEASAVDATFVYLGQMVYGPGKAYENFVVEGIRTGKAKIVGPGNNGLPLTHVDDAAGALVHLVTAPRHEFLGRTVVAAPTTTATQHELFAITAAALGKPTPGRVPTALAALAAGKVNAQVMTLDARCDPDLLLNSGFSFRHESITSGVADSLAHITRAGA